jgi:hypothetical protein
MDSKPIIRRRRFKQVLSLNKRLLALALEAGKRATALPAGPEREKLLRQARVAKVTAELDDLLSSPRLRPPHERLGQ